MCDATQKIFHDENKARAFLEAQRWPNGPFCPYCGTFDGIKKAPMKDKKGKRVKGYYHCNACRKRFTVRVGTLYERSHIPLHKWLFATHLMCASKKGISAHQLHRMLGVTYKSAWFMAHRIREGMRDDGTTPMGGDGKTVEADTTYVGGKEKNKKLGKRNPKAIGGVGKQIVHTLVERGGRARSHHIANVSGDTLRPLLAGGYYRLGKEFARHEMVDHGKDEYVRGDAHSNTAEGFFSILKRGITGIYQHVSEAHLHRYLAEFDFRYSNRSSLGISDMQRALNALKGIEGKRLTYRRIDEAAHV
jgi:transposase-like protein